MLVKFSSVVFRMQPSGRRFARQWVIGVLLALLFLGGCGGDAEDQKQPWRGGTADSLKAKVKKKKRRRGTVDAGEFTAKPEWDMLAPHFFNYVKTLEENLDSKSVTWKYKDAFADRTEKFYPSPEPERKSLIDLKGVKAAKEKEKTPEEKTIESILAGIVEPEGEKDDVLVTTTQLEGPTSPLEKHSLDSYAFRIIMTGVANPEALVVDPDGVTHVVHLNDKLGSEGGYVSNIFKNQVLVRVPDSPEPLTVSLAPEMLPDTFASN